MTCLWSKGLEKYAAVCHNLITFRLIAKNQRVDIIKEQEMIAGCRNGEEKYQLLLFRTYADLSLKTAYRYTGSYDDAREIMQVAMIRVFEKLHTFKNQSRLKSWIVRIVINESLDFLRKKRKASWMMNIQYAADVSSDDEWLEPSQFPVNGEEALKALADLPEMYRLIFCMYAIDGLSHAEIGRNLNISEANSRQLLSRARKQLKNGLLEKKTSIGNDRERIYR